MIVAALRASTSSAIYGSISAVLRPRPFLSSLREPLSASPASASSRNSMAAALEYASTCFFPTSWAEAPLVAVTPYNHDSKIYEFGLPEGQSLNLPVCACMLVRGVDGEGKEAVRPYTPMSSNTMLGKFQLLIKVYEQGVVSKMIDNMKIGEPLAFKHIAFNIKKQYPFGKKTISMIAGGTGITPMYQALQSLVKTPGDNTEIVLLYGNRSVSDILLRDELRALEEEAKGRLKVVHVVGTQADEGPIEGWDGELGWVDKAKVEKYCFPPSKDTSVFVCGIPAMYSVMCGPRGEKELAEGTVLPSLGYTQEMVEKF